MEEKKIQETNQGEVTCKNCAARLVFAPGTSSLKCEYCGALNEIEVKDEVIEEIDFLTFIEEKYDSEDKHEVVTVKCKACGAETDFGDSVVSDNCPFCANPLVVKEGSTRQILKPKSILPFKVDGKQAQQKFREWINGLWWAPGDLKSMAQQSEKLAGMYIPYWTYDSNTSTGYTGQRGDNYQETEYYTEEENGETVEKSRTVTKIMWTYASGRVYNNFDDVLVLGSNSLPRNYTEKLEPWDLENLVPFDEKYLSGFKTETYQVDVKEGWSFAQKRMEPVIETTIKQDIGGDHQTISSKDVSYSDITFKHLLLPLYISAYRYNDKVYRFLINARTGEVQGERPYSWLKITAAILVGLAAIGGIIYLIKSK